MVSLLLVIIIWGLYVVRMCTPKSISNLDSPQAIMATTAPTATTSAAPVRNLDAELTKYKVRAISLVYSQV